MPSEGVCLFRAMAVYKDCCGSAVKNIRGEQKDQTLGKQLGRCRRGAGERCCSGLSQEHGDGGEVGRPKSEVESK